MNLYRKAVTPLKVNLQLIWHCIYSYHEYYVYETELLTMYHEFFNVQAFIWSIGLM